MTIYDLTKEQFEELRESYFWLEDTQDIIEEAGYTCAEEIPDYVIFREYEDCIFSNDDFWCTFGG